MNLIILMNHDAYSSFQQWYLCRKAIHALAHMMRVVLPMTTNVEMLR